MPAKDPDLDRFGGRYGEVISRSAYRLASGARVRVFLTVPTAHGGHRKHDQISMHCGTTDITGLGPHDSSVTDAGPQLELGDVESCDGYGSTG